MAPSVSVIIPAYNAAPFLAECLQSVLGQTRRPDEIIVVDDGSTDATPEIAKSFGQDIRYFRKPNGGTSSARNFGIARAAGSLIALQDADDVWLPKKLALQIDLLSRHPEYGMVYSDLSEVNETLHVLQPSKFAAEGLRPREGWIFKFRMSADFIFTSTAVVRREVFDRVGNFKESVRFQEDMDFFNRVTYHFPVGLVPGVTVLRRRHGTNLTNNYNEGSLRYRVRLLEEIPKEFKLSPTTLFNIRIQRAKHYARLARHDLGMGRCEQSRSEALRSIRQWPFTSAPVYFVLGCCPKTVISEVKRLKDSLGMRHAS
ncbi:MAG: glycosyltransferase family 2 protein [Candidatus Acidiferrales bacterium]